MRHDTSVLVIGGGATGTGIARDLALRGVDVTLAERTGLSSGTSGRSHGLLHSGARYAEADRVGAEECIAENAVIRSIAGECVDDRGGLFVQLPEDDADYFDEKRAACDDIGIDTHRLSGAEARRRVAGLSPRVKQALWVSDGVVYPSRLCAANAADAEDHGGTVFTHAPLEKLEVENGRVSEAVLGGKIDASISLQYVVNATGAWAGAVASMAGVAVEMAPSRGVMISVQFDGLGPVLNRCRDPDDGDIIVPHAGEIVLGTTSLPVSDPENYQKADEEIETCRRECAKTLPAAADAPALRTWWGVRPLFAPDEDGTNRRGISLGYFVLGHAGDGVENFMSIVGGKLTTYRQMAEAAPDHVCSKLGVDAECTTATQPLPGAENPDCLDAFVERYDAKSPTDADIVEKRRPEVN
jgi:glycerol-3-phosphate dehydrogenase